VVVVFTFFATALTSVMIGEKLADPKTVQSLLRHANSKVTMDVYAHALDDVKLAAPRTLG
jgi:integrase